LFIIVESEFTNTKSVYDLKVLLLAIWSLLDFLFLDFDEPSTNDKAKFNLNYLRYLKQFTVKLKCLLRSVLVTAVGLCKHEFIFNWNLTVHLLNDSPPRVSRWRHDDVTMTSLWRTRWRHDDVTNDVISTVSFCKADRLIMLLCIEFAELL